MSFLLEQTAQGFTGSPAGSPPADTLDHLLGTAARYCLVVSKQTGYPVKETSGFMDAHKKASFHQSLTKLAESIKLSSRVG